MHFFNSRTNLIIAGTCFVYLFSGCSKEPTTELNAAKAAIKAAQDVEADKYMAKNFQNLNNALAKAEEEIAVQKKSFFLTRKYKRITEMLKKTEELATEITKEAPKKKEEILTQVKENLGLVKGMLRETADDIKKSARKQDKAVIEELKGYLSEADSAAALANANFKAGEVLKASENLETVQMLINKITGTLKPKSEEEQM